MSNVRTQIGKVIGKSLNGYHSRVKPKIDELKFKEQYQGRIIDCMVGEVDDNYIETPLTDENVVNLEHSKEGVIKIPQIKGKTILVDADGNKTDTPGEGCRLVSVGEDRDKIIILSKNKNLIDKMVVGDIQQETGNLISNKTGVISGYIKVKPNTNYTLSEQLTATSNWYAIFEYDKNKQLLNYHYNKRMLTSSKTHYVAFKYHNANNISGKFQFEEGNIATPIIEPKQHKTEILLDEPLREINGFIQDEIVDNMLYKNVGYKVIDSSLLTNMYIEVTNGYYRITTNNNTLNDWIGKTSNNNKDVLLYREGEKIAWKWNWNDSTIDHFYASNSNKTLSIIISQDKIDAMEGSNFREKAKKYFDKTKFEVFYNIKKIEELPNGITLQGYDDTTMYIENSITPTVSYGYNALIPYKEELLNQKEEVETNTLDIEQNIIPYLMDMEFNLMLMEDE